MFECISKDEGMSILSQYCILLSYLKALFMFVHRMTLEVGTYFCYYLLSILFSQSFLAFENENQNRRNKSTLEILIQCPCLFRVFLKFP